MEDPFKELVHKILIDILTQSKELQIRIVNSYKSQLKTKTVSVEKNLIEISHFCQKI